MRRKKFSMTPELFLQMLRGPLGKTGQWIRSTGLPEDVSIIQGSVDTRGDIVFLVQSETFEALAEGEEPPFLKVIFTREQVKA